MNIILGLSLQRDVINYTRYEYNAADMLSPSLPSSSAVSSLSATTFCAEKLQTTAAKSGSDYTEQKRFDCKLIALNEHISKLMVVHIFKKFLK